MRKGTFRFGAFAVLLSLLLSGCQSTQYEWVSTTKASTVSSNRLALLSVSEFSELVAEMEELMRGFVPEVDVLVKNADARSLPALLEQAKEALLQSPFGAYAKADINYDVLLQDTVPIVRFTLNYGRPVSECKQLEPETDEEALWEDVAQCLTDLNRALDREIFFEPVDLKAKLDSILVNLPLANIGLESYTVEVYPEKEFPAEEQPGKTSRIVSFRFKFAANNVTLISERQKTLQVAKEIVEPFLDLGEPERFYCLYFALLDRAEYKVDMISTGIGPVSSTAYGPLVYEEGASKGGKGTSKGFAHALKMLCDEAGIECRVIFGRKSNRTHYWNMVRINGLWYHTDPAEGDRESELSGAYFLFTDEQASANYTWTDRPEDIQSRSRYYTYERVRRMVESQEIPGTKAP